MNKVNKLWWKGTKIQFNIYNKHFNFDNKELNVYKEYTEARLLCLFKYQIKERYKDSFRIKFIPKYMKQIRVDLEVFSNIYRIQR